MNDELAVLQPLMQDLLAGIKAAEIPMRQVSGPTRGAGPHMEPVTTRIRMTSEQIIAYIQQRWGYALAIRPELHEADRHVRALLDPLTDEQVAAWLGIDTGGRPMTPRARKAALDQIDQGYLAAGRRVRDYVHDCAVSQLCVTGELGRGPQGLVTLQPAPP